MRKPCKATGLPGPSPAWMSPGWELWTGVGGQDPGRHRSSQFLELGTEIESGDGLVGDSADSKRRLCPQQPPDVMLTDGEPSILWNG